jgi:tripartite-type tricarboxylate transporter receptor subunit TctC
MLQADYLQGLYAPAGTAVEVVQKLNASVNRALESTEIRDNLEKFGAVAEPRSVSDFDSVMVARARRSAASVSAAGIKPE